MSTKNFFKIKRLIVNLTFAVLPDKKKRSFRRGSVLYYMVKVPFFYKFLLFVQKYDY